MMKRTVIALALATLPFAAAAQSTSKLVDRYTPLAGSKDNASALVSGLRDGKDVTLSDSSGSTTTFKPQTGKMGNGNVDNTLALAEASLQKQGISNPNPEQLSGAVANVTQQRADGKGWGQIAQSMDVKLGDVKRSDRATPGNGAGARPERAEQSAKPERVERPERPIRPERGGR